MGSTNFGISLSLSLSLSLLSPQSQLLRHNSLDLNDKASTAHCFLRFADAHTCLSPPSSPLALTHVSCHALSCGVIDPLTLSLTVLPIRLWYTAHRLGLQGTSPAATRVARRVHQASDACAVKTAGAIGVPAIETKMMPTAQAVVLVSIYPLQAQRKVK